MGDGNIADVILVCLLKIGLSTIEIQSMIKVGGLQLTRLRKFATNQDRVVLPRSHALFTESVDIFKYFFEQLDGEDRYLCTHWSLKFYVLKTNKAVSWTELHNN